MVNLHILIYNSLVFKFKKPNKSNKKVKNN